MPIVMKADSVHYFEIKPKGSFDLGVQELFHYRELFYFFCWRDLKVKYKRTVLGFLWAIVQPLLMMVILTLFMSRVNIPSDSLRYPVFAFSGLILWTMFSAGITNAGNSMVANAQIIKKIYFPRLIIPISSVLVAALDFAVTFVVFLVLLFFYDQPVDLLKALLLWPAGFLVAFLSALGP